jgi:hypothetical protein
VQRAKENRDRLRDRALLDASEGSVKPQAMTEDLDVVFQTIADQLRNVSLCAASVVLDLRALKSPLAAQAAGVTADSMQDWARPDNDARRADGSVYRKRRPVGTACTGSYSIDGNGINARFWHAQGYVMHDERWVPSKLIKHGRE